MGGYSRSGSANQMACLHSICFPCGPTRSLHLVNPLALRMLASFPQAASFSPRCKDRSQHADQGTSCGLCRSCRCLWLAGMKHHDEPPAIAFLLHLFDGRHRNYQVACVDFAVLIATGMVKARTCRLTRMPTDMFNHWVLIWFRIGDGR